jgi:MoxR-like ATPase
MSTMTARELRNTDRIEITTEEDLTEQIQRIGAQFALVQREIGKVLIGQHKLVEKMLIALLADGHILLEGAPGLAKTTAVKALASCLHAQFSRIQFTPDLLPADLIGTQIYSPQNNEFRTRKGPIFCHVLLADEINRAPAKVQSALLEAMQEHQVTIGEQSFPLPELFLVMATQNPLEQEGTYPLPEAQLDRFLFKLHVHYPTREEEKLLLQSIYKLAQTKPCPVMQVSEAREARNALANIYLDDRLENYILDIIGATRQPRQFGLDALTPLIQVGVSPRASMGLVKAAKAAALLAGRHFVTPHDIKHIAADILRHRIVLSYQADAENLTPDAVISEILNTLPIP